MTSDYLDSNPFVPGMAVSNKCAFAISNTRSPFPIRQLQQNSTAVFDTYLAGSLFESLQGRKFWRRLATTFFLSSSYVPSWDLQTGHSHFSQMFWNSLFIVILSLLSNLC